MGYIDFNCHTVYEYNSLVADAENDYRRLLASLNHSANENFKVILGINEGIVNDKLVVRAIIEVGRITNRNTNIRLIGDNKYSVKIPYRKYYASKDDIKCIQLVS